MTPRVKPTARRHDFVSVDKIERRPIAALHLDPKNARKHSPAQIGQIAKSIGVFGFLVPVLVDRSEKIVAGHGRVLAALRLGWKEVPVICIEHLTVAQARAFAIADNRLTENSTWDEKLLAVHLKELSDLDLDFDIDVTGFSLGEIDLRIANGTEQAEDNSADDVPLPGVAVSQLGDLWNLGKHCQLCGDALKAESYNTLLQGEQANIVFADVPYNVRVDGHISGNGKIKHREFVQASGEMSEAEFIAFLQTAFEQMAEASVAGAVHFICIDWRHLFELLTAGRAAYSEFLNLCVWAKPTGGMGSLYRSQHELVAVFKAGKARHVNNVSLGKYGRNRTNVWQYPGVTPFGRQTDEGNLLALHPTVKPVRLVADALLDCSARGDIVLDPFLGSGSTLIAAEKVGRICYGMDLDPGYVDTAIRRWQAWTGEKAVHAATGRLFDDIERELAHGS
jgi:DNA modification methylase